MNIIELDIPLLIIGLAALIWIRLYKPTYVFQVACQFVGTLWAQYSWGVSWSLGKLVPFLSASSPMGKHLRHGQLFLPFIVYTFVFGIASSFFWSIPNSVEFAYGHGRIFVQLVSFITLVLTAKAFAIAMSDERGVILMWKALMLLGLVHGIAFIYQYIAAQWGLPYIGISRAHGLTSESGVADFAAFAADGGMAILRPGGLAGEPKSAAVVFGIIILTGLISGLPQNISKSWEKLARISVVLSSICFVGTFATSGFIGFMVAYVLFWPLGIVRLSSAIKMLSIVMIIIFGYGYLSSVLGLPGLMDLMTLRTTDRLSGGAEMDPPVAAAIEILSQDWLVLFFGTGIGGGSFYIMEFIGQIFEYALSPNIGFIALLLEFGLIGGSLMLLPFTGLIILLVRKMHSPNSFAAIWNIRFLLVLGLSTMILILAGSGIALGFPLAIGSILGASQFVRSSDGNKVGR